VLARLRVFVHFPAGWSGDRGLFSVSSTSGDDKFTSPPSGKAIEENARSWTEKIGPAGKIIGAGHKSGMTGISAWPSAIAKNCALKMSSTTELGGRAGRKRLKARPPCRDQEPGAACVTARRNAFRDLREQFAACWGRRRSPVLGPNNSWHAPSCTFSRPWIISG